MSGATLTDIAAVLGHKTPAMVKRYAHLSDEHLSRVVARMNASVSPRPDRDRGKRRYKDGMYRENRPNQLIRRRFPLLSPLCGGPRQPGIARLAPPPCGPRGCGARG